MYCIPHSQQLILLLTSLRRQTHAVQTFWIFFNIKCLRNANPPAGLLIPALLDSVSTFPITVFPLRFPTSSMRPLYWLIPLHLQHQAMTNSSSLYRISFLLHSLTIYLFVNICNLYPVPPLSHFPQYLQHLTCPNKSNFLILCYHWSTELMLLTTLLCL